MLKKAFILALMAFNAFTLTNIDAQVPNGYVTMTFDDFTFANSNTFASEADSVNQDLWSFINFRESYIDVDGVTVVSNGETNVNAEFAFKVNGGQHFELIYDDYSIIFTIEETEVDPPGTNVFPYVVVIRPLSPRTVIDTNIVVELSLPDSSVIDSPDATGGFLELLVGYGLYNPVGLLIVFTVVLLISNITLAFLRLPSIVYIAVNLAIGTGFLAFNFIPFWAGFIFLSVITLFLILSIRGSKV